MHEIPCILIRWEWKYHESIKRVNLNTALNSEIYRNGNLKKKKHMVNHT